MCLYGTKNFISRADALEAGGESTIPKMPGSTRDDVMEGGAKSKIVSLMSLIRINNLPASSSCNVSSSTREIILAVDRID